MRRAERAMTLLEVMAAVAILGLLYTYLARAATEGIRSEASSKRRMQASLLADQTLAEIETELAIGQVPPAGTRELVRGDFLVVVEATPFELPTGLLEAGPAGSTAAPSLFGGGPRAPNPVIRISVRVQWRDGITGRSIERVTFALDRSALRVSVGSFATSVGEER